jgi:hypothetical protein
MLEIARDSTVAHLENRGSRLYSHLRLSFLESNVGTAIIKFPELMASEPLYRTDVVQSPNMARSTNAKINGIYETEYDMKNGKKRVERSGFSHKWN